MTIKPIPGFTTAMRAACAQIADAREHSAKTQKAANELYAQQTGDGGRALSDAFCDHAADVAAGIAAAIRCMPVAPPLPEPLREAPMLGTAIWYVDPVSDQYCVRLVWDVREKVFQDHILNCGLCHASKEAAEAHGGYLASLSAKTEDAA